MPICILHERARSQALRGILTAAQMESHPDVNLLKYLHMQLCLISVITMSKTAYV